MYVRGEYLAMGQEYPAGSHSLVQELIQLGVFMDMSPHAIILTLVRGKEY